MTMTGRECDSHFGDPSPEGIVREPVPGGRIDHGRRRSDRVTVSFEQSILHRWRGRTASW